MRSTRKSVLIIEYTSLPDSLKDVIREWVGFGNDCLVPLRSEFQPFGEGTWKESFTKEQLKKYHEDQTQTNGFKGTLSEFIEEYGLQVDEYLMEQKIDLDGVEDILVSISC